MRDTDNQFLSENTDKEKSLVEKINESDDNVRLGKDMKVSFSFDSVEELQDKIDLENALEKVRGQSMELFETEEEYKQRILEEEIRVQEDILRGLGDE